VRAVRGMEEHSLEIDYKIPVDPEYVYKKRQPRKRQEEDDFDDD
jgi:hypothetical protein